MKNRQRYLSKKILYDTFDLPTTIINIQRCSVSKRKINPRGVLELNPQKKKYIVKRECIS